MAGNADAADAKALKQAGVQEVYRALERPGRSIQTAARKTGLPRLFTGRTLPAEPFAKTAPRHAALGFTT